MCKLVLRKIINMANKYTFLCVDGLPEYTVSGTHTETKDCVNLF